MKWIICQKKQYDKKGAQTALNNILRYLKRFSRRKEIRYYHCPLCNTWHLTSTDDDYEKLNIEIKEELFKPYLNDVADNA